MLGFETIYPLDAYGWRVTPELDLLVRHGRLVPEV
jgi:hypothetical protein